MSSGGTPDTPDPLCVIASETADAIIDDPKHDKEHIEAALQRAVAAERERMSAALLEEAKHWERRDEKTVAGAYRGAAQIVRTPMVLGLREHAAAIRQGDDDA